MTPLTLATAQSHQYLAATPLKVASLIISTPHAKF